MLPDLGRTIRNVRRAERIVVVLARYGFSDIIQELGLDRLLQSGRRVIRLAKPQDEVIRLPRAVRLRQAMEQLGPTFVKLAQVLSTRPDLVPADWADEFAKLQDDVAQEEPGRIRQVIDDELGDRASELFESIEPEALAAASVAQVHRARLKTGEDVVLKVLRPGVRQTLQADVEILGIFARVIEDRFKDLGYSPVETVDQFARELRRETDLTLEARSTDRLRRAFEDDPGIFFPRVHMQATTSSVLCLEYIQGTVLSRRTEGMFSPEERRAIVVNGSRAVFRQCLEIGFFHADPHPGNIIVLKAEPGQAGPICFIDCGMTGHIDPKTAERLADLVQGAIAGDLARVVDVIIAMSDADPAIVNSRVFNADVWEFISHFQGASLGDLKMGALLREFMEKLKRNRLRCPADLVFLIKAISTIEGVGEELSPGFDIVELARPYIERLVRRRYGIGALRSRLQSSLIGYAEMAETLPRDLNLLLTSIQKQKLTINMEHRGLEKMRQTLEHSSRNIARALLATALLVASSILAFAGSVSGAWAGAFFAAALVGFAIAGVMVFAMVTIGRKR